MEARLPIISALKNSFMATRRGDDCRGKLIETRQQSEDSNGNTIWMDTLSVYDADGHVVAQTDPFVEGTTAPITGTLTSYDGLGDVTADESVTGMVVDTRRVSGNDMNSVLASPGNSRHDDDGRTTTRAGAISSTDQYGHETITTYDQYGRVVGTRTQSVDPDGNTCGW